MPSPTTRNRWTNCRRTLPLPAGLPWLWRLRRYRVGPAFAAGYSPGLLLPVPDRGHWPEPSHLPDAHLLDVTSFGDERHPVRVAHAHQERRELAARETARGIEGADKADHAGVVGRRGHRSAGHPDVRADREHARGVVRDQQAAL